MVVYPTNQVRNPVNWIEMQLLITFAQEQNFSPRCHVVTPNWLRIVCNVALGLFSQISQVLFTGLGLCKTSTLRNLQSVRLKV